MPQIQTNDELALKIGALLYSPAANRNIVRHILEGDFFAPYSVALCLEDTISNDYVETAEQILCEIISELALAKKAYADKFSPLIFIRVRSSEQLAKVALMLQDYAEAITGFIFPKFSLTNIDDYLQTLSEINKQHAKPFYMMPILESSDLVDLAKRTHTLCSIKEKLDAVRELVLNVRVGGNDFCNYFGLRRNSNETIYDIGCVRDILTNILTVFAGDYVVSGPVWEYFADDNDAWQKGLMRELQLDRLNGFIGKTAIHPKQIPVILQSLQPSQEDFVDAQSIITAYNNPQGIAVAKSAKGGRMNEFITHYNWAQRIIQLAAIYGVRNELSNK